eukprot:scaffold5293_cov35-Prasinocladus_malaysianus.AAC.1
MSEAKPGDGDPTSSLSTYAIAVTKKGPDLNEAAESGELADGFGRGDSKGIEAGSPVAAVGPPGGQHPGGLGLQTK